MTINSLTTDSSKLRHLITRRSPTTETQQPIDRKWSVKPILRSIQIYAGIALRFDRKSDLPRAMKPGPEVINHICTQAQNCRIIFLTNLKIILCIMFSEEGTVKEGWRYYTENLYLRDDNMTTIYETKECEEEATILEEEVRKALKALSNGKSPGSDGIPIELLKEVDEEAINVLTAPVLKWGHIVYDFWYDPYYSYGTKTNCPRLWTYVCCHLAINEPSFREKIPPTRWRLPVLAGPAILDQVIIFCRIIVDVVNLSNTYIDCNALALL